MQDVNTRVIRVTHFCLSPLRAHASVLLALEHYDRQGLDQDAARVGSVVTVGYLSNRVRICFKSMHD